MYELTQDDIDLIGGGLTSDATYGGSLGVSTALLGLALGVTLPVWGTAALLGGRSWLADLPFDMQCQIKISIESNRS